MIVSKMKNIIKYAIELDIEYLETFLGYEGDNVLKISTKSEDVNDLIVSYIKNLDLNCKAEYELSGNNVGSYVIYVGVENPSIFKLKRD